MHYTTLLYTIIQRVRPIFVHDGERNEGGLFLPLTIMNEDGPQLLPLHRRAPLVDGTVVETRIPLSCCSRGLFGVGRMSCSSRANRSGVVLFKSNGAENTARDEKEEKQKAARA